MTPQEVHRLFQSGRGNRRGNRADYDRVAYAINRGWVRVVPHLLRRYPEPELSDKWRHILYGQAQREPGKQAQRDSGNHRHGVLKWRALNWLVEQGHAPQFEYTENGRRFDVFVPDKKIAVECGNVDPAWFLETVPCEQLPEPCGLMKRDVNVSGFYIVPFERNVIVHLEVTESGREPMQRHVWCRMELRAERNPLRVPGTNELQRHVACFRSGSYAPEYLGSPPL